MYVLYYSLCCIESIDLTTLRAGRKSRIKRTWPMNAKIIFFQIEFSSVLL